MNKLKPLLRPLVRILNRWRWGRELVLFVKIRLYANQPPKQPRRTVRATKSEMRCAMRAWSNPPLISILMPVYNVAPIYLRMAVESVLQQVYQNYELILVDDASTNASTLKLLRRIPSWDSRIQVHFLNKNSGIAEATNYAASKAKGEYFSFLDHDDEITPDALYETVKVIVNNGADFVYSDESIISESGKTLHTQYKSGFNQELLYSCNYITHFVTVKAAIYHAVGGCESKYNGAQDYQLTLKATAQARNVVHIPKVLYHWRALQSSAAHSAEAKPYADRAGLLALNEHFSKHGVRAAALYSPGTFIYRTKWEIVGRPMVSIIIPFKDKAHLLDRGLQALLAKTGYEDYEIVLVSNNSTEQATHDLLEELKKHPKIRVREYNKPFNFSAMNNYAVSNYARGDFIVFMNNDVEVLNSEWLTAMLEHAQRADVGAVGALLVYPDFRIQHAGITLTDQYAGVNYNLQPYGHPEATMKIRRVSAVTAALMMVDKRKFLHINGFAEKYAVALNDVDFCLRLHYAGYHSVYTPYAQAIHRESSTRGYDEETREKRARFAKEVAMFQEDHKDIISRGDPYFNPW